MTGPDAPQADLSIIIVSTNEARWLEPCLRTVFERAGGARLDVVVVDNGSTDGTRELVETQFPEARVVDSVNRGFAHANNRGAMTSNARYVLFLNPDTEVVDGTFGELVAAMDERPEVGLAGVRQLTSDGELWPDDPLLPERVAGVLRGARLGEVAASAGPGRASGSSTCRATTARSRATGRRARSCSPGARRC